MKTRAVIFTVLVCSALAGMRTTPARSAAAPAPALAGGWHAADTAEATKAARFALPHLKEKHPRLRRILTAEQQIVAGVNVRITLLLRNGHRWRVTVWRKLDGGLVVTDAVRVG